MRIQLPAKLFRAAQTFTQRQAVSDAYRGVILGKNNMIIGTDGQTIFCCQNKAFDLPENVSGALIEYGIIIVASKLIPKSWNQLSILIKNDWGVALLEGDGLGSVEAEAIPLRKDDVFSAILDLKNLKDWNAAQDMFLRPKHLARALSLISDSDSVWVKHSSDRECYELFFPVKGALGADATVFIAGLNVS